jgi:hypothetical protein
MKNLPLLFRRVDAEKWTEGVSVFLNRAIRKEWIHRIQRGYYVNSYLKGWPEVEETGCYLRTPAYVSGEWALHAHGILLQVPQVCMIITLQGSVGRSRTVRYQGIMLEFSRIAPPLFIGFERRGKYDLAPAAPFEINHIPREQPSACSKKETAFPCGPEDEHGYPDPAAPKRTRSRHPPLRSSPPWRGNPLGLLRLERSPSLRSPGSSHGVTRPAHQVSPVLA